MGVRLQAKIISFKKSIPLTGNFMLFFYHDNCAVRTPTERYETNCLTMENQCLCEQGLHFGALNCVVLS